MRATKANIYLDNLRDNISCIKSFLGKNTKMCVAVKADGYGHGAVRVAVASIKAGASFLAVASVQEGIELREAGIVAPILSLSLPLKEEIPLLLVHSITPLVFDEEFIISVNSVAENMHRKIPVHLKIDTGMGRVGCKPENASRLAHLIDSLPWLYLEGCCTHFAASESPVEEDVAYTKHQIKVFNDAIADIRAAGIDPGIIHCANTGAIFLYPEAHFDMVRPGIAIYGYFPEPGLGEYLTKKENRKIELKPVMELCTQVVAIKHFKKGESISYNRTWVAEEDCDIGVLPVGYADGLMRRFSPGLNVVINGKKYPVVGRICMDQCMICLGNNHDVHRWDKVVIFGPGEDCLNAEDLAESAGTISYEILCAINKRVPRVYIDTEKNY
ncbi:MAG: alanine racemase [Spirochaetaceae bacterium]|nr:alanine racemase [Spirochaetaceae bacterium]